MVITLSASHQTFLMEDIFNWSCRENQLDVFIESIEFVPFDGEKVSAVIKYRKV